MAGRPKGPAYRSYTLRFSKIEDKLLEIVESLKDEKEKKLVLDVLEKLKPVS